MPALAFDSRCLTLSALVCLLVGCGRTDPAPAGSEAIAPPPDTASEAGSQESSRARPKSPTGSLEDAGSDVRIFENDSPFHALIETGVGDHHWISAGTFVDSVTLAVPYEVIDEATDITIDLGNCEDVEVLGVVGVDRAHRIALIGLATPPVGVAPLPVGQPPAPGDRLGHRFIFTRLRPPCGFMSGSSNDSITVLDVRELDGFGLTPVIDVAYGLAGMCSPIVNSDGELVALLAEKAAGASSMTFPAVMLAEIERHPPIPLAEHAVRMRTVPEAALLLRHHAERSRVAGDLRDALARVRESDQLAPDEWETLYELGVCLDMSGQPGPARDALARSIAIEPGFAESHYSLGIVRLAARDPASAIASLEAALALDPNYANAAAMLSAALYGSGQLEAALRYGERAIVLDDTENSHFANLCMMYTQAERHDDAGRVAALWTEAYPSDPDGWFHLGDSLLKREQSARASDAFRRAIDLGSTGARVHQLLIVSLEKAGEHDRARRAVEEALERYPGDKLLLQLRTLIEREG